MNFKIQKEPYNEGEVIFSKENITLNHGLTVLVGCNGSGKSTFLRLLEKYLSDNKILYMTYDNIRDGGLHQADYMFQFQGDLAFLAEAFYSSEGEKINLNLGMFLSKIHKEIKSYKESNKEIFILCDAIDSGFSIDMIDQAKDAFEMIINDIKSRYGFETYIIASANEYELARKANCFDVTSGEYITFKDYDDYRNFILQSAKRKEERYNLSKEKRSNK